MDLNKYKALNLFELIQDKESKIEWVVDGLIPKDEPSIIYGKGEQFKSAVVLNICMNVQEGLPVAGLKTQQMRVLWLALEGHRDIAPRIVAHQYHYGESELTQIWAITKTSFTFGDKEDEAHLYEAIKSVKAELVVIDTLSYAVDGDISTGNTPGIVTRQMRKMCDDLGISLIVIAHSGKDITRGIKGASEFFNNMPCVILINNGSLELKKMRSSQSGKTLKFSTRIIDTDLGESFCIEWDKNSRLDVILDSFDKLSNGSSEVTKKELSNKVYERYPGKSKDSHRTQFNRDLETLNETKKLIVSSDLIKRNTDEHTNY